MATRARSHTAKEQPDKGKLIELLRQMMLIRRFEEKAAEMYARSKIGGFLHLYIGQEAVGVGAISTLGPSDYIVSHYREHGHALARGVEPGRIMAELFGRATGVSRGRGGSMHLFDVKRGFMGGYAIVGGHMPLAVGLALASSYLKNGRIVLNILGDGAVNQGEFHESLNLAALWRLPVLFLCENNLYAMGTALARHQSQPDIRRKADAYGMPSDAADGMDVVAVEEATRRAAERVRRGDGPVLLELRTYRFRAHSTADPELYRSKEEVAEWKQRDPIALFGARLQAMGILTDADLASLEAAVGGEIDEAVRAAEAGPWEPVEDLTRDVYTGTP